MQPIPLIHVSALNPATQVLDEIGAPTAALLSQERLPSQSYGSSNYVPIISVWSFVDNAAKREGLWDFGFRIAERVTVAHASRWGPRVSTAVTLRHAIQTMNDWIGADIAGVRVGLARRGNRDWFWRDHQPDRRDRKGYWAGEQYVLELMLQMVRMVEGPNWLPRRLQVQASARDWMFERPDFAGEAQIEFGAEHTAIELPEGGLERRLSAAGPGPVTNEQNEAVERPGMNLESSLHQVLRSVACERKLSLDLGAEFLETSQRSLQRSLHDAGTSWREVLDGVRLETTLDLMNERTRSLTDIAALLGYSDYPHFHRAFVRWTGESPREYRTRLDR